MSIPSSDSASAAVSPTPAEVQAHLQLLAARHSDLVACRAVTRTAEGRPIWAASVTDPAVDADEKQHALIVAGQHGNEESGRMVALALLDWLVSGEGAETRRRQRVVVMPDVNPDAAARDGHKTPGGVHPNLDHAPGGARTPEGQAVETVASELQPELFVDMHACGDAGCGHDMVLYPWSRPYNEDGVLLSTIAAEMVAAGEAAGIPHLTHPLTWPGWGGADPDEPTTTRYAYRSFKSLVFLTESSEHNTHAYPAALRTRCGLERMKTLLAHGNRRHPWLPDAGYPVGLIGLRSGALVAAGPTSAARRASRVVLWRQVAALRTPRSELPEQAGFRRVVFGNDGPDLDVEVGVQIRCGGHVDVRRALLDGRPLAPAAGDGYAVRRDVCSTFIVVTLPRFARGSRELVLELTPAGTAPS